MGSMREALEWWWGEGGWDCREAERGRFCRQWHDWGSTDQRERRHKIIVLRQMTVLSVSLVFNSFAHPKCSFIHASSRSFIHLFIQSVSLLFIHSVSQLFIHSFSRSVTQSVVHSLINSYINSSIQSSISSFIWSFVRSFTHSFVPGRFVPRTVSPK